MGAQGGAQAAAAGLRAVAALLLLLRVNPAQCGLWQCGGLAAEALEPKGWSVALGSLVCRTLLWMRLHTYALPLHAL